MNQNPGGPGALKRLGKYEIQTEVGRGGMGVVYRGYDSLLDRPVAIKVLAPHLVWEPGFVERFLREARTAARLKHAGIVAIYDVGQEGSNYYIVMEYLQGRTLSDLVRQQGPLSPAQALAVLQPLAAALDFAHQQDLVHRDVKPSNIVVHPSGHVTLTDFGVARAAHETRLTTTGALVGTPQYMSPEQAQGDEVDHRTDIYSLGVVTYEMLAGHAPFDATTPHAVLHQVIYEPSPPLRTQRRDLPRAVDGVLAKALAKEPTRRFDTAGEFLGALREAFAGQPSPVASAAEPGPQAKESPQISPRRAAAGNQAQAVARPAAGAKARPRTGWRMGVAWFLVTILAWLPGWALGIPVANAVGMAIGPLAGYPLLEVGAGAASWMVLGLAVGLAQWLLLRRRFAGTWEWILATVAGFGVVGSIKWAQGLLTEQVMDATFAWLEGIGWEAWGLVFGILLALITEGLTGLLIGLAQWVALQNRVRRPGRWVLVSTAAWAGAGLLISLLMLFVGPLDEETATWLPPLLSGVAVSAITALGALWILPKDGKDQQGWT